MKRLLFALVVCGLGSGLVAHADTISGSLTSGLTCSTLSPCGTITVTDNLGGGVTVSEDLAPNFFVVTGNGTNHVSLAMDLDVAGLTAANFTLPTYWTFGTDATPAGFSGDYDYYVQFDDPNCNGSSCTGGHTEPTSVSFTISGVSTANFDLTGFPFVSDINVAGATGNVGAAGTLGGGPTPTPEPSSLALLGTGALGLAGVLRRKFRRA
jgi:hypothetical protein